MIRFSYESITVAALFNYIKTLVLTNNARELADTVLVLKAPAEFVPFFNVLYNYSVTSNPPSPSWKTDLTLNNEKRVQVF